MAADPTDASARVADLTPPPFAEGLADWSRGDGTPTSPNYEACDWARIAHGDADFGACLELRKVEPVQRLRYMGEMPIRPGAVVEISVRLKAVRGPLPVARLAAWPGGMGGVGVIGLPTSGATMHLMSHGVTTTLRLAIGPTACPGVDLRWDARALYAHVGLDLLGPCGGVVRIEDMAAREMAPAGARRPLPGFQPEPPDAAPD